MPTLFRMGILAKRLFKKKKIALNPVCFPPMATAKTDMLTRTCNIVYFRWGASGCHLCRQLAASAKAAYKLSWGFLLSVVSPLETQTGVHQDTGSRSYQSRPVLISVLYNVPKMEQPNIHLQWSRGVLCMNYEVRDSVVMSTLQLHMTRTFQGQPEQARQNIPVTCTTV